jgi:hypothetical protein
MLWCTLALAAQAADVDLVEVIPGRPSVGRVEGTVDAPLDQVLSVIGDCAGTARWFPDMLESRLVSSWEGGYRCAGATDLPWPLKDRTWTIDVALAPGDDGAWIATFDYVPGSGNLAEMSGRYVVSPGENGRTDVTYEGRVDLGFWLPCAVVAWATAHLLPEVVHGLERAAPPLIAGR